MNTVLIEPTDLLFFRDAIPMSAGQGKGAGCRMPFPSTLHEAFRACLLREQGEIGLTKSVPGRPRHAPRKGNWHGESEATDVQIASKSFRSLRTIGPLPWHTQHGLLLPVPMESMFGPQRGSLHRLQLWRDDSVRCPQVVPHPADYRPPCLPMAVTPPDKHGQLNGWWTVDQMRRYLDGDSDNAKEAFEPLPTSKLWKAEQHVGVEIEPGSFAAKPHRLYGGSHLRANRETRFWVQLQLGDERAEANGEGKAISGLNWLLLGGEFRLARLWQHDPTGRPPPNYVAPLKPVPTPPPGDGPCLLKWMLVTPAIFAHGSLPGWCADTRQDRVGGSLPVGRVCFELPGRAQIISWCLGKPRVVSGWDVVEGRAKPTLLAVPEGGVYYFLCENRATAGALAKTLHWQPRSDFYGEKGCGYGLTSFDVQMQPTSADVAKLAGELFNC
jgi:CRISPR type III-B/RAMP module-associated protein Cmr3